MNSIKKNWDGVGELEISVHANQEATLRYTPSPLFTTKYLGKFVTTTGNEANERGNINSPEEIKARTTPANGSYEICGHGRFAAISKLLHRQYRKGEWLSAADTLRVMATILRAEGRSTDELKILMLIHYIELSGIIGARFTSADVCNRAKRLIDEVGLNEADIHGLYSDTIRDDMNFPTGLTAGEAYLCFCWDVNKADGTP